LMGSMGSTGTVPVLNPLGVAAMAEKTVAEAARSAQGLSLEGPVNAEALAGLVDGDWVFARGLVQSFTDTANAVLPTIGIAIAARDWLTLSEAAHVIKGAGANLFATAAAATAGQLEDAAKLRDVPEIERCAERLRIEVAKAAEYFRAWMEINEP
jgi:HPt (histidine-containing phosphotransfer) domain-containing protein